ncbi:MAG TPA: ATP-grasp domain-containing protein [Candidatus Polarisedimenticolaceae bacterium]|nr:ATP-grasp domain-containing protein [Candidatus Polarisedimenticolaceae bacterium]
MNVLMISPGYPAEMPFFTRGLAAEGARVFGLGDQPREALPHDVRSALVAYLRVDNLWDEPRVVRLVRDEVRAHGARIDRVECLWEPGMILAARLREALGAPGLSVAQTVPFRDKQRMKEVLDAAGIRTPWHVRASSAAEVRAAAERRGYPLIVKPIAGAGSSDTYRVDDRAALEAVLPRLGHVPQVSVEEFVDGDEFTFDTVCVDGRIAYENVSFYRPRPLEEKQHEWISPSSTCLRDLDQPELQGGRRLGRAVLRALGFRTGFTHMEWYRRHDGEVVFGEIGARPPGARLVHAMNFASDIDLFRGWAEAVCHERFSQPVVRRYNAAVVFKRARGQGRIQRYEGLERLRAELGPWLVAVELQPIGSPRQDWRSSSVSDGWLVVRHPDLQTCFRLAERVGSELQLYAG